MRRALPLILAGAISSELIAENLHESLGAQPHIEPEFRVSTPTKQLVSTSPGVNGGTEPLGTLRTKILYRKRLRAGLSKDKFALPDAYVETAHELMKLRAMQPFERQIQFDCFRAEIERTRRGRRDFSNALPAIANALGVPYPRATRAMKLSCGNCQSVQPFSEQPPTFVTNAGGRTRNQP